MLVSLRQVIPSFFHPPPPGPTAQTVTAGGGRPLELGLVLVTRTISSLMYFCIEEKPKIHKKAMKSNTTRQGLHLKGHNMLDETESKVDHIILRTEPEAPYLYSLIRVVQVNVSICQVLNKNVLTQLSLA